MQRTLREWERLIIAHTLIKNKNNKTHTARELGIGLRTLHRKLKAQNNHTEIGLSVGIASRNH